MHALEVAGVTIHLELDEREMNGDPARIQRWIGRSARIVAAYYGRFPVRDLAMVVVPASGERITGGTTFGQPRALIRVRVGRDVSESSLLDDWVLVHEMTHLALPDVGPAHAWLSEGLATYVEGIARVQAHNRAETDVWAEDVRSMPHGLPQPGDAGLDHTHTWGRTYWGGALFCLLADIEIHQRTGNRLGLQDALRAVLAASGGLPADWPVARVFEVGDRAVGTPVLEELYAQMNDRPVMTDLPALWMRLGVEPEGASVRLRDDAPLAAVRLAIMRPRTS
ncbi:MAG TPA: hypothetical protein VMG11_06345 [Steroidobacteraceae bacterium]|nr:hypothetical protein [Steroidobacteraceae bacterium]